MYIGSKGLEHSYLEWALPESEHMAVIQMVVRPECMEQGHMAEVVVEQFEVALEVEYMAPIVAVAAMVLAVNPIDNYMMAVS